MFYRTINEFRKNYKYIKINESKGKYEKKTFVGDDTEPYVGWTSGDTWNGWECPYFEKDVADKILVDMNALSGIDWGMYDAESDSYKFAYDGEAVAGQTEDNIETFEPQFIETPEGKKKVWSIGGWSWVWSLYNPDDELVKDGEQAREEEVNGEGDKLIDDAKRMHDLLEEMVNTDFIDNEHGMYGAVKAAMDSNDRHQMYEVLEEMLNNGIVEEGSEYYDKVRAAVGLIDTNEAKGHKWKMAKDVIKGDKTYGGYKEKSPVTVKKVETVGKMIKITFDDAKFFKYEPSERITMYKEETA